MERPRTASHVQTHNHHRETKTADNPREPGCQLQRVNPAPSGRSHCILQIEFAIVTSWISRRRSDQKIILDLCDCRSCSAHDVSQNYDAADSQDESKQSAHGCSGVCKQESFVFHSMFVQFASHAFENNSASSKLISLGSGRLPGLPGGLRRYPAPLFAPPGVATHR